MAALQVVQMVVEKAVGKDVRTAAEMVACSVALTVAWTVDCWAGEKAGLLVADLVVCLADLSEKSAG